MTLLVLITAAPLTATAQDDGSERQPTWKRSFDDVQVETIKPADLPSAEESTIPPALSGKTPLPRATTLGTLRASSEFVDERVIEVIVVPRTDSPLRHSRVAVRGAAVWADADGTPVLVTNAHWLKNAEAVFVKPTQKREQGSLPYARRRTVTEMQLGADVKRLLEDPALVKAEPTRLDEHRNLAVLTVPDDFPRPEVGLSMFPIASESPGAVYGFSPQMGSTLVQTLFLAPRTRKKKELEFYLHTNYPVVLGAPIVDAKGRLLGITAMRHPTEQDRTLVIPPLAMQAYLAGAKPAQPDDDRQKSTDERR